MCPTVAVFGGSFNPPVSYHREVARRLSRQFDEVLVVPCGPRPDKPVTNDVHPVYRAAMVDMTFSGLPGVSVELFDLERSCFTRTLALEERFAHRGEIWHVVDSCLVSGGAAGRSAIQQLWEHGQRLWQRARFVVVNRGESSLPSEDLPPRHQVLEMEPAQSGDDIRHLAFTRRSISAHVVPGVDLYIQRHALYRGMHPPRTTSLALDELRPVVVHDERSPQATELAATLPYHSAGQPNLVVVIGGDGTMLRAIRTQWRRRLPFYGINAGHMGFLLNRAPPTEYLGRELVLEQLPLLRVETEGPDGGWKHALAFNDAWVERATGQTAWLEVRVDGRTRLPQLVADGALVSTAAGSTSYARAMGASPLPMNTPALLLVGSNVLKPHTWKPVVLPLDTEVELATLDPDKRPLQGYIDGIPQGEVRRFRARVSNSASVELAFDPRFNPADKLARVQFPLPER